MKTFTKLKTIKAGNLLFAVREGTSDFKAIKEVVIDGGYEKKGFSIESGETWIDIGANCGAFCVLAASRGAKVIAFEPDPENASIARANIEANRFSKSIQLHDVGLTEKKEPAEAAFFRHTANGNLWRNGMFRKWNNGETIKIKTVPVEPYWSKENCVKLDAEGIEMPILERFAEIRLRKLVFEWSFDIDGSISRFEKTIGRLRKTYPNIFFNDAFLAYSKEKGFSTWQPSWFPACRTVWCW